MPINELEDVTVEKLGLVTAGANRETIFLMKSDPAVAEGSDSLEAKVAETIWAKLTRVLKSIVEGQSVEAVTEHIVKEQHMMQPMDEDMDEEKAKEMLAEEEKKHKKDMPEADSASHKLEKGATTMSEKEMIAKSDYDILAKSVEQLNARLVKAEAEAEAARDSREREARIVKAAELSALPVTAVELGGNLHKLAKLDPALEQYFSALIKTADEMLTGLGIFEERGTAQAAAFVEPVAKAAKSANPREALPNLSKADAAAYVQARQVATGGKGLH